MSAEIKVHCAACGQRIAVPAEMNGRTIACPVCGDSFRAVIRLPGVSAKREVPAPALTTEAVPLPATDIHGPRGFSRPTVKKWWDSWLVLSGLAVGIVILILACIAHLAPNDLKITEACRRMLDAILIGFVFLLLGGGALTIYFTPVLIAWHRRHRNFIGILLMTLLLGWTFLLWVVALIWSLWADQSLRVKNRPENRAQAPDWP